jgi:hypothetical protein
MIREPIDNALTYVLLFWKFIDVQCMSQNKLPCVLYNKYQRYHMFKIIFPKWNLSNNDIVEAKDILATILTYQLQILTTNDTFVSVRYQHLVEKYSVNCCVQMTTDGIDVCIILVLLKKADGLNHHIILIIIT